MTTPTSSDDFADHVMQEHYRSRRLDALVATKLGWTVNEHTDPLGCKSWSAEEPENSRQALWSGAQHVEGELANFGGDPAVTHVMYEAMWAREFDLEARGYHNFIGEAGDIHWRVYVYHGPYVVASACADTLAAAVRTVFLDVMRSPPLTAKEKS